MNLSTLCDCFKWKIITNKVWLHKSRVVSTNQSLSNLNRTAQVRVRDYKVGRNEFTYIMVKEDILLGLEMGRLEIEPLKPNKSRSHDNEHLVLRNTSKKSLQAKCSCPSVRKQSNVAICKRKSNKIIREPVLRILKYDNCIAGVGSENQQHLLSNNFFNSETLSLCTLVQNCNQLKISSESNEINTTEKNLGNKTKWWRNNISVAAENKESRQSSNTSSCSQQALNPPCDVTIDELASYFETLVHIPKKMSSMAEMMYI